MSEDDREVESMAERADSDAASAEEEPAVGEESPAERSRPDDPSPGESAVDRAAESFLAIEADLRNLPGGGGALVGLAKDAERVPAATVPERYPVTIETEEALRLRVQPVDESASELSPEASSVYFAWPPDDDGPLARLLALRDIDRADFADLHGERIPVAIEDGFLVPRLPPGGARGTPEGIYGVYLSLGANVAALLLLALGAGAVVASPLALLVLALLNLVVLPLGTYLDARHLLTTTDWNQGPLFWAALAMLPGVNVLSSLAYLWTRRDAEPL